MNVTISRVVTAGIAVLGIAVAVAVRAEQEAEAKHSVWDGVFTEEQSKRGQALYLEKCASCHMDNLAGGESAPALTGDTFESSWNGLTVGALFDRTRISMPQDRPGSLSRQQVADVVSYVLDVNKFPRGSKELDTNDAVLKAINLETAKPGDKPADKPADKSQ